MTRKSNVLKVHAWPETDKQAWETAFSSGPLLEEGGLGSNWADGTRRKVEQSYGRYLFWLNSRNLLSEGASPAKRVTKDLLREFHKHLQSEIAAVTAAQYIIDLSEALRVMDPEINTSWLMRAGVHLSRQARPIRDKASKIRSSVELLNLGCHLINTARTLKNPKFQAVGFRNGLMIALLSLCPHRRAAFLSPTLSAIEIGNKRIAIHIEAQATKTNRRETMLVPEMLIRHFQDYITVWRPILENARSADRLWLALRGDPLGGEGFYGAIRNATRKAFGTSVNPHLFRDCFVTTIANSAPAQIDGLPRMLQHKHTHTTRTFYDHAGTMSASRQYADVVEQQRKNIFAERKSRKSARDSGELDR